MSNKSQLKTNNTQIQSLTIQVQSIKDNVENLPSNDSGETGGLNINGIVKEYQVLAGESINAGDFVEFTKKKFQVLDSAANSLYASPSCVALSETKVFIAYPGIGYYLYGAILDLSKAVMTMTKTQLSSTYRSCFNSPHCILLSENKVLIIHEYTGSQYLAGTIVNISGTAMTATTTQLETAGGYKGPKATLVSANKVFVASGYSSDYYLRGSILTISGNKITLAADQTLNTTTKSGYYCSNGVLISDNKIFMAHAYSSSYYLYGTIINITNTTMTSSTHSINTNAIRSCWTLPSCALLSANKILIVHTYTSSNSYLAGTIVDIISQNETYSLTSTSNIYTDIGGVSICSCSKVADNKIYVAHKCNNYTLGHSLITVDGATSIIKTTMLDDTQYSCYSNPPDGVCLNGNKVFIAHGYTSSKQFGGTIAFLEDGVFRARFEIEGVAKTGGQAGSPIKVYTPK